METEEIVEAIENGKMKEKWDDWVTNPFYNVRMALAKVGYKPETLIHSSTDIAKYLVKQNPELIWHLLGDAKNLTNLTTTIAIIENESNLPKEVLIQHMSDLLDYNRHYNVTNLLAKIAAIEHKPKLIEQTMTPKQLYKAGSPLWAKSHTPREVYYILNGIGTFKD